MIAGLLEMAVANAAAALGAWRILQRVRTGVGRVDAVLFLLIRILLVSGTVLVAGMTGTLRGWTLGLAGAAFLAILAVRGELRLPTPGPFPRFSKTGQILLAVVAVRLAAQVWLFAPYNYDATSYHLLKVAEWVRAGAFTREMGLDSHVSLPAGFELIEAWWALFLRHDVIIELAGVEFLILAIVAAYGLAGHVGLTERSSLWAAFLCGLVPGLHLQATSCLNDGAAAGLVLATFLLVAERAPLSLVVMTAGIGVGIKPTYAYLAPGFALLWLLGRKERGAPCPPAPSRNTLASLGILVGAFWYLRNAAWYGNPFYPVGRQGLSDSMGKIQMGFSLVSLRESLSALLDGRVLDRPALGPMLTGSAGWGAVAVATGTVGILMGARENTRLRRLAFASLASVLSVLTLARHDPWNARFILFFPCVLTLAAAWLGSRSPAALPVIATAATLCFVQTLLPDEVSPRTLAVLWNQGWRERSMAPVVFGETPPGDVLGCFFDVRRKPYPLYRPDFSRRLVYLRANSADELEEDMRSQDVRYVFAYPHLQEGKDVLSECLRRGILRPWKGQFFVRRERP